LRGRTSFVATLHQTLVNRTTTTVGYLHLLKTSDSTNAPLAITIFSNSDQFSSVSHSHKHFGNHAFLILCVICRFWQTLVRLLQQAQF